MNDLKDKVEEGTQQVIDIVQKNRRAAVEGLRKVNEYFEKYSPSDTTEQEVVKALQSTETALEALNSLGDMLTSDLVNVIKNMNEIGAAVMQTGASVEVLLQTLVQNGVLTQEQIKETFENLKKEAQAANSQPPAQ